MPGDLLLSRVLSKHETEEILARTSTDSCVSPIKQAVVSALGCHLEAISQPLLVSRLEHIPEDVAQLHCRLQGRCWLLSGSYSPIQQAIGCILLQGVVVLKAPR